MNPSKLTRASRPDESSRLTADSGMTVMPNPSSTIRFADSTFSSSMNFKLDLSLLCSENQVETNCRVCVPCSRVIKGIRLRSDMAIRLFFCQGAISSYHCNHLLMVYDKGFNFRIPDWSPSRKSDIRPAFKDHKDRLMGVASPAGSVQCPDSCYGTFL